MVKSLQLEELAVESIFDKIEKIFNKPGLEKKVNFFRLLAVTQNAGLGIRDALTSIKDSEKHPGMKKILEGLIDVVNQGYPLSEGLKLYPRFFSSSEIALIKSSETMGNMPEILQNIADELENFAKIKGKIKSAMLYPTVVIIFAIISVIILLWKVVPTMVSLFPSKDKLPLITKVVLAMSDFIKTEGYMLIFIFFGIVLGYKLAYTKLLPFKYFMDKVFLEFPVVGELTRLFNQYRFSKLLGDFYEAGVSLPEALGQIADVLGNVWYKDKVKDIGKDIEVGLSFWESIEGSQLFDPILIQVIGIGEETGNMGQILQRMADFYRDEFNTKIEGLMKLIEPFLMAFVAGLIGFIVASVFLPMADLIGQLSNR